MEKNTEEYYDYSQHSYCITFDFDNDQVFTDCFFNGYKEEFSSDCKQKRRASLLYSITRKEILDWGDKADKRNQSIKTGSDIIYINNIFTELNNIYQKKKEVSCYSFDVQDNMVLHAVNLFLKKVANKYQLQMGGMKTPHSSSHFAFFLPTNWDNQIREDLVRPLFIRAKLIAETDHHSRLLFFARIESSFRYIQSVSYDKERMMNARIENGKQYILCGLKFVDNKLSVNLDLVKAHYPSTTAIKSYFVTELLKSACFSVLLDLDLENNILACMAAKGFDTDKAETRKVIDVLVNEYKGQKFICSPSEKNLTYERIHSYRPFQKLDNVEKLTLNGNMMNIIQSTTIEEIHAGMFESLRTYFVNKLSTLLKNAVDKIRTLIALLLDIHPPDSTCHNYTFNGFIQWMVLNWLKEFLKTHGERQLNYNLMTFGNRDLCFPFPWGDMLEGNNYLIKDQIHMSNTRRPPSIIPAFKIQNSGLPSIPSLEHANIVYIDISSSIIKFSCAYTQENDYIKHADKYIECNIVPLDRFFFRHSIYQHPLLHISDSMLVYMKKKFDHIISIQANDNKGELTWDISSDTLEKVQKSIIECLTGDDMNEFFSETKYDIAVKNFVIICQPDYVRLFLMIYLGYLNKLVAVSLPDKIIRNNCAEVNVGYVISVEKMLLNDVFDSKKLLQQLLIGSGLIKNADECSKVRIVVQGERILPAIQYKLNVDLALKSYFVVAQLHPTYIHVSLNQVVNIAFQENTSTIVVKDKIIAIENSTSILCKRIWNHYKSTGKISYCTSHKDKHNILDCNLDSFQSFKNVVEKVEHYVQSVFSATKLDIIMDEKSKIYVGDSCDCKFYLSLRNIIDIGLKPMLQTIATTIAASVVNVDLFRNYTVDFVFILGNVFNIATNSILYFAYTKLFQDCLDISIESKEKDLQGFVLSESLCQLLEHTEHNKPYMWDSFKLGNLQQVSKETYGIYVNEFYKNDYRYAFDPTRPFLTCRNSKVYDIKGVGGKDSAMIVLHEGQLVEDSIPAIEFGLNYCEEEINDRNEYSLDLALVKLRPSDNSRLGDTVSLVEQSYDRIFFFLLKCDKRVLSTHIILEMKHLNYSSSVQFALRMNGDDGVCDDPRSFVVIGEQLTVAYF